MNDGKSFFLLLLRFHKHLVFVGHLLRNGIPLGEIQDDQQSLSLFIRQIQLVFLSSDAGVVVISVSRN